MSKHKYVCFDCLQAVKRDPHENSYVACPSCGNKCTYIGVKIPIPPKSKPKEWQSLRLQIRNEEVERLRCEKATSIARKHKLEKEIRKLEALEPNSGRLSLIQQLKGQLAKYKT